jgi:hypothetical protein
MKFGFIVGAVSALALSATVATAQVCQGDLSFRGRSTHVGGALGISDNATSFGGGLSYGHAQGWYGGGNLGMITYDNVSGNSITVGGGLGYQMPLQRRSKWQVCPGGTFTASFGPTLEGGAAGDAHISAQTVTLGTSFGTSVSMSRSVNLLPFGSIALGHTRVAVDVNGNSNSDSDNYVLFGMGAGFQLTPTLVVRPALSLAAGNDAGDDTIFGLSLTWALPR